MLFLQQENTEPLEFENGTANKDCSVQKASLKTSKYLFPSFKSYLKRIKRKKITCLRGLSCNILSWG